MSDPRRVRQLLEDALDSDRTPDDVCAGDPDLLAEVRAQWDRVRVFEEHLSAVLPAADRPGGCDPRGLPVIPGYEVEAEVGRGGMGVVYKARHLRLNRPVAVKMLPAGAYASPAEVACLLREAEAVAALRHPHVVPVYDVGDAAGVPYFTMEFADGGNLARRLAGTPQPAGDAAALVATLAGAVDAAHRAGIIHRDLKPANVLLTADDTPKVSDFGLARRGDPAGDATRTGGAVGTPSYMAPEQAAGEPAGPAADVYALGAVLYECLTGRPPFRADTAAETERQVIAEDPAPPRRLNATVPRDLETVCLKCLHKDPRRRYPSAAALADDLGRFLRREPVTARPVGRLERAGRWARRNPSAAGLVVAAASLVGLGVLLGVLQRDRVVRQRAEANRWEDRLSLATRLQQDGRFVEARATLSEARADNPDLDRQVDDARARLDLVERLDAVRLGRARDPQGTGLDYAASSRRYAEEFRAAGLGGVGEAPELVARRLAPSPVRKALIAALDDWAACAEKQDRDWVLAVLRRLDPDPWRDRVRDPDAWANAAAFPALAAAADIPSQPVTLMVAFGTRWRRLGGDPAEFLERVQRQYPTDFWVNFELGHLLYPRDSLASVGYLRAALVVRPDAANVHFHLGGNYVKLGRADGAIFHYQRGLEADPEFIEPRNYLGLLLLNNNRPGDAIEQWRRSLALNPDQPGYRRVIRAAQARLGRHEEACDEWQQFLAAGTDVHANWDGYAELCLYLGREEGYRRTRRELLDRFESSPDLQVCERTARACLLAPSTPDERRRSAAVVDRIMAGDWARLPAWVHPFLWFAKGLAEYRQDRLDGAIAILRDKTAGVLGPAARLVTAMAEHRLGRKEAARKTLASAVKSFEWEPSKADSREAWMYHVLRREAETLIAAE